MADEHTREQATAGKALRRRGILAAAGAAVAGIVAKQANAPVAADSGNPLVIGRLNYPTLTTDITILESAGSDLNDDLLLVQNFGSAGAPIPANSRVAILGYVSDVGATGPGDMSASLYGVLGQTNRGTGVYGIGGLYGVRGDAGTAAGAAGLLGYTNVASGVAFGSVVTAPGVVAGYFNGEVHVHGGAFVVDDMTMKHGAVPHPDGTKRLMYSVEAPESWVEDFGEATLVNGHADVPLDKDFAAVIHADTYHAFLTPRGDSKGLYVASETAAGFTVREQQGGTSNLSFSYRVVAKPNVGKTVARLPKYVPPPQLDIAGIAKSAHDAKTASVKPVRKP